WPNNFFTLAEKITSLPIIPQQCDVSVLEYPLRAQKIMSGTNQSYRLFLHRPSIDFYISDSHWNNGVPGAIAFEADYQPEYLRSIQQIQRHKGKKDIVVFDIGANIGTHAIFFALQGVRVHAFEPSHVNFRLLQCSVVANRLTNVILHNVALSNQTSGNGDEWCISTPGHKMLTKNCPTQIGTQPGDEEGVDFKDNTEGIKSVLLDDYWIQVLKKKRIDMIKMDVEGHEPLVFLGAHQMFTNAPPYIVYSEFQPKAIIAADQHPVKLLQRMWGYGYTSQIFGRDYGFSPRMISTVETANLLLEHIRKLYKDSGIYLVDIVFIHNDLNH
ncbi:hypothetical protein HK096_004694, partial [Nowakowskiella sp. JEL0078]